MNRSPVRVDGKETLRRLKEGARSLFAANGYRGVSIPMIAKMVGIKTPSFYHYFNDKTAIYEDIVESSMSSFEREMSFSGGNDLEDYLRRFFSRYLNFMIDFPEDYRIIKEATHFNNHVQERSKAIMNGVLESLPLNALDHDRQRMLELFLTSPVRWIGNHKSLRKDFKLDRNAIVNSLVDFALHGMSFGKHRTANEAYVVSFKPLLVDMKSTKASLLEAAEELFGSKGFHETHISDITRRAGVALGTFYVHFSNKKAILEELIGITLRGLKNTVSAILWNFSDRRDAEIAGYKANLEYFKVHYNMCNIVMETEFTYPEIWKGYYDKIQLPWERALQKAIRIREIRQIDPSTLSLFLMGIGHYLTQELVIYHRGTSDDFSRALRLLAPYICRGIHST